MRIFYIASPSRSRDSLQTSKTDHVTLPLEPRTRGTFTTDTLLRREHGETGPSPPSQAWLSPQQRSAPFAHGSLSQLNTTPYIYRSYKHVWGETRIFFKNFWLENFLSFSSLAARLRPPPRHGLRLLPPPGPRHRHGAPSKKLDLVDFSIFLSARGDRRHPRQPLPGEPRPQTPTSPQSEVPPRTSLRRPARRPGGRGSEPCHGLHATDK